MALWKPLCGISCVVALLVVEMRCINSADSSEPNRNQVALCATATVFLRSKNKNLHLPESVLCKCSCVSVREKAFVKLFKFNKGQTTGGTIFSEGLEPNLYLFFRKISVICEILDIRGSQFGLLSSHLRSSLNKIVGLTKTHDSEKLVGATSSCG